MKHNSDFRFDLELGVIGEKQLADVLQNKKIEVKTDFMASQTGNVFVEYESRGKKSGIASTESEYYAFIIGETIIIRKVEELKVICRRYLGTDRDVLGGDKNTSKGIKLPIIELARPMSREELLKKGECCGCGCKNCPYTPRHIRGVKKVRDDK